MARRGKSQTAKKKPARAKVAQGRKRLSEEERKAIARRVQRVVDRDYSGVANGMETAFGAMGKTAAGWLKPRRTGDSLTNVAAPDLTSLVKFARLTKRRVGWLIAGEEPEFVGDSSRPIPKLAVAFAARAARAVADDMGVPVGTTVRAVDPSAVLDRALQLLVEEQRRIREQVAPLRRISEVVGMLKAIATLQDDMAASALGVSLSARLADAVAVRSPVQFGISGPWERVSRQDKGEAQAWLEFLTRSGLPEHLDAMDVELAHYAPMMGATGTIGGVPIPLPARPAASDATGSPKRQRQTAAVGADPRRRRKTG